MTGRIEWRDGTTMALNETMLTRAYEQALRALTAAVILLAVALVLVRVT